MGVGVSAGAGHVARHIGKKERKKLRVVLRAPERARAAGARSRFAFDDGSRNVSAPVPMPR